MFGCNLNARGDPHMKNEISLAIDRYDRHFPFFDGTLDIPNRLTLKWIPNYYFELNEGQSTLVMYAITLAFCIGGIILF